jgi:Flp pilus assembly protein TadD
MASDEDSSRTLYALIQKGVRAQREDKISQAAEAYRQAVNQLAFPLNQLAWLAYKQGDASKGLSWARLAVQLQPEEAQYFDTLAVILCTLGEREEAIVRMETAVQLESKNKEFRDKLQRFRQGVCQ